MHKHPADLENFKNTCNSKKELRKECAGNASSWKCATNSGLLVLKVIFEISEPLAAFIFYYELNNAIDNLNTILLQCTSYLDSEIINSIM